MEQVEGMEEDDDNDDDDTQTQTSGSETQTTKVEEESEESHEEPTTVDVSEFATMAPVEVNKQQGC
jgi:hypothetical protein